MLNVLFYSLLQMKRIFITAIFSAMATFISAQNWETSFDVAKSKAQVEGKNIVLTFSGSDWCIPCMKLEKNIWESPDFKAYSKEHFILLRADFPKKRADALPKEQQERNDRLAEIYNKQGLFPLVLILDKRGKTLGSTGYKNISPKEYIALLHSFEIN
jgi:thioredoxin-related protein